MEQRAKLLVVDDEQDITELLKWQLDSLSQTVYTALSGRVNNVLKTGDFVLAKCQGEYHEISKKLMASMDQLEAIIRRLKQLRNSVRT